MYTRAFQPKSLLLIITNLYYFVDNISVLQLPLDSWDPFYIAENLSKVDGL